MDLKIPMVMCLSPLCAPTEGGKIKVDSLSGEIEMVIHQGGRKYNPAVMMVITLSAVVVNNLTLYQV
ncbi:MAG: hypothetical protein B6D69_01760 [gamma proteobacterium symbiont of Stewartia floridana]|nr:MAG: hypothetical protein B6D76_00210 [gamma proteobacterium symbiont of Stewartia floridana]RLW56565.1 MAG: hypothetical protein B6D69_01760 [gamma proteobacterium symbiont of Stewartia floridana]RLW70970.1 MAG: hypothetical protein B6D71_04385 [gamma proteobacterium symbiont of Stewartia floridana]